jgi:hypothetical protein
MSKRLKVGMIVVSFLLASLCSLFVFAIPPTCTSYWNTCQQGCMGSPELVVYGEGYCRVHCTNVQNSMCTQPDYYSIPCMD